MVIWDEPLGQLVVCIHQHFDTRPKRDVALDVSDGVYSDEKPG